MKKLVVILIALLMALPVIAKEDKGHKAGGMRDEHASEMGLEKGKAYAGTKEKAETLVEEEEEDKEGKEDKEKKKEKKEKKEMKQKKEKKEKKEKKSK